MLAGAAPDFESGVRRAFGDGTASDKIVAQVVEFLAGMADA